MNKSSALARACTFSVATLILISGTGASLPASENIGASSIVTSAVNMGLPYWASDADKAVLTDKFQGSITEISTSAEADAELRAVGVNIDWAKSLEVSNAYNEANNTSVVLLVVDYDNEVFNQSEFGSIIDIETPVVDEDGTSYFTGFSIDTSDYTNFDPSVNVREHAIKPSQVKYQWFTGLEGRVARQGDTFSSIPVNGVDAYFTAHASPIVETMEGGLPSDTGSHTELRSATTSEFSKTVYLDNYKQTPERQADLRDAGLRVINPDNAVDITGRDDTVFNMSVMATGVSLDELAEMEESGNNATVLPKNLAITNNIEVKVKSDRFKVRNAHIGQDNAHALEFWGAKAFLTVDPDATNTKNSYFGYHFSQASAPIVPVDPSMVIPKFYAGNLEQLAITDNYDGGIRIENRWNSDYAGASTNAKTTKGPVDTDTSKEEARLAGDRADLASLQERKAEFTDALAEARASYNEAFANGAPDEELERLQARIDNTENSIMGLDDLIPQYEQRVADSEKALAIAKDRPSDTYTFTYTHVGTNGGAEGPKEWSMNGSVLPVGQTWTSSAMGIDATFTVTKNDTGQLVVEMKLSEVPAQVTELSTDGTIGTGLGIWGGASTFEAPGYSPSWFSEDTPEVIPPVLPPVEVVDPPAPETPVLPPVQVEDPTPGTSTSIQQEVPGDGDSLTVTRDPLADSAIEGVDTGSGWLTAVSLSGVAGLLAGIVVAIKRRLRLRNSEAN